MIKKIVITYEGISPSEAAEAVKNTLDYLVKNPLISGLSYDNGVSVSYSGARRNQKTHTFKVVN